MIQQDWSIKSRGTQCALSGRAFVEDEPVWTVLFWGEEGYDRKDVCAEAWETRPSDWQPVSTWKSPYKTPPAVPVEALRKDDAEGLLKRLIEENEPGLLNARYVLALMLERKRMIKPLDRHEVDGRPVIVYEHVASGETWIVEDPKLHLDQLEPVQNEVTALLKQRMSGT